MEQRSLEPAKWQSAVPARPERRPWSRTKTVLLCIGVTAVWALGYVLVQFLPGLPFVGLIWAGDLGAPTQEQLVKMTEQNLPLLEQAVLEAGKLGPDAFEISTRSKVQEWRREDLGELRGMFLMRRDDNGNTSYEPLENETLARVMALRYVEAIELEDGGFRLDCGGVGIVPSGASFSIAYRPGLAGLLAQMESGTLESSWPYERADGGWRFRYGGDDALLLIPITENWVYLKEVW